MSARPFSNADPFLQIIVLFLVCFVCLAVFMLAGSGLANALWGVNFLLDPNAAKDFSNPHIVNLNRLLLVFQHLGLFIVPAFVFAKLVSTRSNWYLGFRPVAMKSVLIAGVTMILALPFINLLGYINEQMVLPEWLSGLEALFQQMEESGAELTAALTSTENIGMLIVNIVIVAVLPAIGEELIFRGILLPILHKWTGKVHAAVWISAVLFSAMHLQFYGFLPRMVLGAVLGYMFVYSGSIWAPIIAHFANNAIALVLMFLINNGTLPESIDSFDGGWSSVALGLVSAGIVFFGVKLLKKGQPLTSDTIQT